MSAPVSLKRKRASFQNNSLCFCYKKAKTELGKDGQRYSKCGTEIEFKKKDKDGNPKIVQKLGCGMFLKENEVDECWAAIKEQDRFKTYVLKDHKLHFAKEWPKCSAHNLFMRVKVNRKEGKYHGQKMMTCAACPPDAQCDIFEWISGQNRNTKVFGPDRRTDYQWLKDHNQVEAEDERRAMEQGDLYEEDVEDVEEGDMEDVSA